MPNLDSRNRYFEYLREGYDGRAVPMLPAYPYKTVLIQLEQEIDSRARVVRGPLYYGEAEQLLLDQLEKMAVEVLALGSGGSYTAGQVVKQLYAYAAQFSIIAEIAKVSQAKDVANKMSAEAVQNTPIYKALLTLSKKTEAELKKDGEWLPTWTLLDKFMSSTTFVGADVLGTLLKVSTDTIEVSTLQSAYQLLARVMRTGKGYYLTPTDRVTVLNKRAKVRAALATLIEKVDINIPKAGYASDALALAFWYLTYLNATENYDVVFPKGDFITQSQAWVMTLRSAATRMAEAYTDLALAAFTFDICIASDLYNSTLDFFTPLLIRQSSLEDVKVLYDDALARFDKVANKYMKAAAADAMETLRKYVRATHILPETYTRELQSLVSSISLTSSVSATEILADTGMAGSSAVLLTRANDKMASLISDAANITNSIDFLLRAKAILRLQLDNSVEVVSPLTDRIQYKRVLPVVGNVGVPVEANFSLSDPLTIVVPKWTYDNKGARKWVYQDKLFNPQHIIPLMQENISEEPLYVWPSMGELPMGDPITKMYSRMPIPFAYSKSRNRSALTYDMTSLRYLLSGRIDFNPLHDTFGLAATALVNHFDEWGQALVDYLSSVVLVYKLEDNKVSLVAPKIPAIYGMPLKAFLTKNKRHEDAKTLDEEVSNDQAVKVEVERGDGKTYLYFVLHKAIPKEHETMPIAYTPVRGVVLTIPLYKATYDKAMTVKATAEGNALQKRLVTAEIAAAIDEKDIGYSKSWLEPQGFAPFLITLPHMLFEVQVFDSLVKSADFLKFAVASISRKVAPDTGDLSLAAFTENPIVVFDAKDLQNAYDTDDPEPISGQELSAPGSIQGGDKAVTTRDNNNPLKPQDLTSPTTAEQLAKSAANVATAPIIHESTSETRRVNKEGIEEVVPIGTMTVSKLDEAAGLIPPADRPLSGGDDEGGKSAPSREAGPIDSKAPASKVYYKKVSEDGTITDVIELDSSDPVPSGYVPASRDEYETFKRSSSNKEND